jgi:hypothetical protein
MKGNMLRGNEEQLHHEKKHPGCLKNSVHMQYWRGEFRPVEARKIIGRRETCKGCDKQGTDHRSEEITVVAPSGQPPASDREGLRDCRHMLLQKA